ncbi:MAG: peptidoglycan-associated lipoprotein Pal [Azoarcus sp.]|nr:peptidoglycan-associated lipoprotein Pal [Azoarcus sp.]
MKKLLLPSLVVLALAACGTDPATEEAVLDDAANNKTNIPTVDTSRSRTSSNLGPRDQVGGNSVFFDYDSYVIRSEARPLIDAHAKRLAQESGSKVTIQGNADERGSREYNLALGQKRAEAVRRALRLLGARDAQIEAVSMGEEHPACTDSTESCYAQNRRGDFVYLGR